MDSCDIFLLSSCGVCSDSRRLARLQELMALMSVQGLISQYVNPVLADGQAGLAASATAFAAAESTVQRLEHNACIILSKLFHKDSNTQNVLASNLLSLRNQLQVQSCKCICAAAAKTHQGCAYSRSHVLCLLPCLTSFAFLLIGSRYSRGAETWLAYEPDIQRKRCRHATR